MSLMFPKVSPIEPISTVLAQAEQWDLHLLIEISCFIHASSARAHSPAVWLLAD